MGRMPLVLTVFLATCFLPGSGLAQHNQVVRIGVTVMENSAVGMSSAAARDRLIKALNRQKDKKAQLSAEGVALDATAADQIIAEAKQKGCDYVLQPKLTEAHEQGNVTGRAGNASNVPEYSASIDYKLFRVSDGSVAASGSAKATDVGSQVDIIIQALDRLAGKALADARKSGIPASPATQ